MPAHIHAANMALYAQDAAETDRPWARWEYNQGNGHWHQSEHSPNWQVGTEYRRKPRTIRIGEFDVPEPLRMAPERGAQVFNPCLDVPELVRSFTWLGLHDNATMLQRGVLHVTREAAEIHAKALVSLSAAK